MLSNYTRSVVSTLGFPGRKLFSLINCKESGPRGRVSRDHKHHPRCRHQLIVLCFGVFTFFWQATFSKGFRLPAFLSSTPRERFMSGARKSWTKRKFYDPPSNKRGLCSSSALLLPLCREDGCVMFFKLRNLCLVTRHTQRVFYHLRLSPTSPAAREDEKCGENCKAMNTFS